MKSYTDLEQSKKLAEILSIESADQTWERIAIAGTNLDVPEELQYKHNGNMPFKYYSGIGIPCWSLAALLEQLDDEITDDNGNDYNLTIVKESLQYQLYYHDSWGQVEDIETNYYDDLVDACYEMILKLNELNLL